MTSTGKECRARSAAYVVGAAATAAVCVDVYRGGIALDGPAGGPRMTMSAVLLLLGVGVLLFPTSGGAKPSLRSNMVALLLLGGAAALATSHMLWGTQVTYLERFASQVGFVVVAWGWTLAAYRPRKGKRARLAVLGTSIVLACMLLLFALAPRVDSLAGAVLIAACAGGVLVGSVVALTNIDLS